MPARRSHANIQMGDRRDLLSPLAVTKRCIRYEPHVFHHRKPIILELAHTLNNPEKKIILVGGQQGSGKTSLVRGLIELMGSRNEQLLWFDVNRHTDFEEIIQFLIHYITYVCSAADGHAPSTFKLERRSDRGRPRDTGAEEPLQKLEKLINQVGDMPLLLVLDNVEYIVDAELRFNSYPFKEMLNFLLAFPNIKMVLSGERLPYADMSPNQDGVADIKVSGLTADDTLRLMQNRKKTGTTEPDPGILEQAATPEAEVSAMRQLYAKTHGYPWLLKGLFHLNQQLHLDFSTLNRLLETEAAPETQDATKGSAPEMAGALARLIYARLPDQHRKLIQVLALLRHPINAKSLQAMASICYPILGPSRLDADTVEDILEHSLIRSILKINYPPQEVLAHIRHHRKGKQDKKFKPWYELYHVVKRALYQGLPPEERERLHSALQDFYLREKSHEPESRVVRIKNRALLSEAKFHGSAARGRKSSRTAITPPSQTETVEDWSETGVSSKAYLYRHVKPLASQQRFTSLEDYRNIQLPASMMGDEAETSLDGPTFLELTQASNSDTQPSFQDTLAGLELSDEEKNLLHETSPPGDKSSKTNNENLLAQAQQAEPDTTPSTPPTAENTPSSQNTTPDLHHLTNELMTDAHEPDEQEKAIQKRLTAAVAARDKIAMVRELLELARYRAGHGQYEAAAQCLEKALSLKAETNKAVLAELYRLNGSVNKETYHHNAAMASLAKAAVYIKRLMYEDDTVDAAWMGRLGEVYQNMGEIQAYRKQYNEAVESFNQSLHWYQSADDNLRQAEIYFQLADLYDERKDSQNAILYYEKTLALDEANGCQLSAASTLANLGNLYYEDERYTEALDCFQRSLTYDRAVQNLEGQLNTLERIVNIHAEQENWPLAEHACQKGLSMAVQEGLNIWKASFYMKLGRLSAMRQHWPQALTQYELARSIGEQELSSNSLAWIDEKISEAKSMV